MSNPTTSTLTVAEIGEHAIIERIVRRLDIPSWVEVGPGDDAAVVKPPRGRREVLTTDALVDGVHFDRAFVPPDAIGHRALAVNLSDLAAMGAEPRAALLSLALPGALALEDLDGLLDGFLRHADAHRTAILGGNITRTPGPLVINVTAIGTVKPRRALTRAGARPGDDLYVTGWVGDAAAGLAMLRQSSSSPAPVPALDSGCAARYLRPEPRLQAGQQLAHYQAASSCVDLSDGLADGLRQLAAASGIGVELDANAVPMSREACDWHASARTDALSAALGGGDDYELLFTVRPRHRGRLRGARRRMEMPITRIGVVTRAPELVVRDAKGSRELPPGFEHFR